MKKCKNEEKIMEPMFPRLHINDTDKGPRAPPRNKMALYEQLSIPAQHSSSKGTGYDKISVNLSPSINTDHAKKLHTHPHKVTLNLSLSQPKHNKNDQGSNDDHQSRSQSDFRERTSPLHRSDSFDDNDDGSTDGDDIREHRVDRTYSSLSIGDADKSDTLSETSMVDSILQLDITPDDVVGMMGRKHFWRARRAIINQQRVFAIQLFELHRLIKVQQLIAGSTELIKECALLKDSTLKDPSAKKFSSQYVVKMLDCINKCNDNSNKRNNKRERSAEKAVGKAYPRAKADSRPSVRVPDSGNRQLTSQAIDTKMASFNHPSVHQWLFPVMSPSEGLIYKPCLESALLGPVFGGYGPYSAMPLTNHQVSSACGIPAHDQGFQIFPTASCPPFGVSYFSPYGMPIQSQNSLELPTLRPKAIPSISVVNSRANIARTSERSQTVGKSMERRDVPPYFPMAPGETADGTDQPTQPIRVVPHSGRSANESATRIFRSIQKERKQNDSI